MAKTEKIEDYAIPEAIAPTKNQGYKGDWLRFDYSIGQSGKIHLVWDMATPGNIPHGELYYSCYSLSDRMWSHPAKLLSDIRLGSQPVIAVAGTKVHILCADRRSGCIHLTSTDNGASWHEPENLSLPYLGPESRLLAINDKLLLFYSETKDRCTTVVNNCANMVTDRDYRLIEITRRDSLNESALLYSDLDSLHCSFDVGHCGNLILAVIGRLERQRQADGSYKFGHSIVYTKSIDVGATWQKPVNVPIVIPQALYQPGLRPQVVLGPEGAAIVMANQMLNLQSENKPEWREYKLPLENKFMFRHPDVQTVVAATGPVNYRIFWIDSHLAETAFPHEAPDDRAEVGPECGFMPWLPLMRVATTNDIFSCTLDKQFKISSSERLTPPGLLSEVPVVRCSDNSTYLVWKGQRVVNHVRQSPQLFFRIIPSCSGP